MVTMDQRTLQLVRALIRCRSVTPEDGGAIELLDAELKQAGGTAHRLAFAEGDTAKIENLYARLGEGRPHLCFAGHTDVVPPGDEALWSYPPFAAEIADGKLYGRGAADMKGAIACFVSAALDYFGGDEERPGTISFLITGDEEGPAINGTRKVLDWMRAKGIRPDHCLVGEPTSTGRLGEAIKIGRRGSLNGRLVVEGVQGHVAYPQLANNPVKGLIKVLALLHDTPLDFGSVHFSPSNLEVTSIDVGNQATNVIPARAEASFNIRFNDKHSAEALMELLRAQIKRGLAGTELSFELAFAPPCEFFVTQPGPLDALLSQAVNEITGLTPRLATDGGTSDARFIKDICPVVEFGLLTETIHKADEHVSLADLSMLTAIYRRFIALYFEAFASMSAAEPAL